MKTKFLFILIFVCLTCFVHSQDTPIDVSYDENPEGTYNFYCTNKGLCTYTVEVTFPVLHNLKGLSSNKFVKDVERGQSRLLTLRVDNPEMPAQFEYSYTYIKGCLNPKIKSDFVYLLPVGNGKTTSASKLTYLAVGADDKEPKDHYALMFRMSEGDTIFAARRGIVSDIKDTANLKHTGYSYSSEDNFIEIFHGDCTFGKYQVLSKSLVNLGDEVEAGDPIAIAGGEKYAHGYQSRFDVHYNYEDGNSHWAYIPLVFHTSSGARMLEMNVDYIAEKPESVITQEMSKKQIKKWKSR